MLTMELPPSHPCLHKGLLKHKPVLGLIRFIALNKCILALTHHLLGPRRGVLSARRHWNPVKSSSVQSPLGLPLHCQSDGLGCERPFPSPPQLPQTARLHSPPLLCHPVTDCHSEYSHQLQPVLPWIPVQSLQCAFYRQKSEETWLKPTWRIRWYFLKFHSTLPAHCSKGSQTGRWTP